jgi:VanZ family protein
MFWRRSFLVILGLSLMVVANLAPGTISVGTTNDKLNHFLTFSLLTPVVVLAFPRANYLKILVALGLFAMSIELAQGILQVGREPDLVDWAAGILGTVVALALCHAWRWSRRSRQAGADDWTA